MPFSFRTYLLIGVVFGGLVFLLAMLFGDSIAAWAVERQIESAIKGQPIFEQMVFGPLEFLMAQDTRLVGAVGVVFLWPAFILLVFMILVGLVALEFIEVNETITNPVGWWPLFDRV